MKDTVPESVMEERRLERLQRLNFFMRDARVPANARRKLSLYCALNLLTGYFQNSLWRAAWWVTQRAARDSYERARQGVTLFWHCRVMRRPLDQVERILFRD